ncbi:MAG: hypothetical protein M1127_03595 [Patescibacteria group bacterium]|nr:hypothetical protein [Patescibacteria group bacterium]
MLGFVFSIIFIASFGSILLLVARKLPALCAVSFERERKFSDLGKKGREKMMEVAKKSARLAAARASDLRKVSVKFASVIAKRQAQSEQPRTPVIAQTPLDSQNEKAQEMEERHDYWDKISKRISRKR